MCAYWDTKDDMKRNRTVSKARKYDRKGLGEHKHYTGQKSYGQVQQEIEKALGRLVSLGEVFFKIHTRPDGTFADLKAEKIAKTYEKILEAKCSELEAETTGDTPRELNIEDCDDFFLQSTIKDSRGASYGLGSLTQTVVSIKRKLGEGSSMFQAFQEQLAEIQNKMEEQAEKNARREAELLKIASDQENQFKQFSFMEKSLRLNPSFVELLSQEAAQGVCAPSS